VTEFVAIAVGNITCPRCGATPGQVCVTRSSNRATQAHSARIRPIVDMWRKGYGEGIRDALEEVKRAGVLDKMPYWLRKRGGAE